MHWLIVYIIVGEADLGLFVSWRIWLLCDTIHILQSVLYFLLSMRDGSSLCGIV